MQNSKSIQWVQCNGNTAQWSLKVILFFADLLSLGSVSSKNSWKHLYSEPLLQRNLWEDARLHFYTILHINDRHFFLEIFIFCKCERVLGRKCPMHAFLFGNINTHSVWSLRSCLCMRLCICLCNVQCASVSSRNAQSLQQSPSSISTLHQKCPINHNTATWSTSSIK